jgi:diketogulonate reductase-like aldo/keto reductase
MIIEESHDAFDNFRRQYHHNGDSYSVEEEGQGQGKVTGVDGYRESAAVIPTKFLGMNTYGDPVFMPLIGTGTWQYNDTIAYQSVCKAFEVGYTFVDTAFGYRNQRGVGKAIRDCWTGRREDLFVLTKIPGGLNTSQVHAAHQQNLLELGLDYVDHLMTHFPSDWDESNASPAARQEEWLALEAIYKTGQARTIGISHYCSRHILDIMWVATVTPAINQVEYHIGSQDIDDVIDTCADLGITFMSFSPLCGPCQIDDPSDSLISGDLVTDVAAHYDNVSGSQVSLRYIVQQGIPVVPKSNSMEHVRSNFNIFNFELSDVDMKRLKDATEPAAEAGDCDVQ